MVSNHDRFPVPRQQLTYAINLMTGSALDQVMPLVHGEQIELANLEAIVTILEVAFGDPDRIATAKRKLETLAQGGRDFSAYYAEFQRLVADVEWNENVKKHSLTQGLSHDLRQVMIHHAIPAILNEYLLLLQQLDNRIRDGKVRFRPVFSVPTPRVPAPTLPVSAPAVASQFTTHPSHTPRGVVPMDLSNLRPSTSGPLSHA